MLAASYSTSIALSRMALISLCLLLCSILPCFAAKFRVGGSEVVAFVGSQHKHQYHTPTFTTQFVLPISSSSSSSRQHHHSIHYYDTNRRIRARQSLTQKQRAATSSDDDNSHNDDNDTSSTTTTTGGVRARVRQSVTAASQRVQNLVLSKSSKTGVPGIITDGSPIADLLIDAGVNAAELAREEVRSAALNVLQRGRSPDNKQQQLKSQSQKLETQARIEADATIAMDTISLAKTSVADAFDAAESALLAVEKEVKRVRQELNDAKKDATLGLAVAEKAASEAKLKARMITEMALKESLKEEEIFDGEREVDGVQRSSITNDEEEDANDAGGENAQMLKPDETLIVTIPKSESEEKDTNKAEEEGGGISGKWSESDFDLVTGLSYEDVDYTLTDMAPPFISEDECLVPGEPVVRVEKAPQNSRRIFAGIDIPVSVDDVWKLLTDYPNLQKVVPNLVVNEVLELYEGGEGKITVDDTLSADKQCQLLANHMKGAVLKQVGGAKVVGINFSARTTLEVREWPTGMPDFAHFEDEMYEGKSRSARVRESKGRELTRYVFPRPFALSTLPHKDISMQSIENDDGEFRMYQGVWRMQPLVGCAPPGQSAMRLTYAVEVSPRPYLPVALVEGRIAQDLCANLKAIRNIFEAMDSASAEDR